MPLTSVSTAVPGDHRPWLLLREQLPFMCRAVRWRPIIGAAAIASLLTRTEVAPVLVIAVVAIGLSYVLDDPATVILDATPTGRARRRTARVGLTVSLTAALWLVVVQPLWSLRPSSPATVPADLAVATLAAVVLAAAVVRGGIAAAPVTLAVGLVGPHLPDAWSLVLEPGQSRNWVILLVASSTLVFMGSRDPGARRRWFARHRDTLL